MKIEHEDLDGELDMTMEVADAFDDDAELEISIESPDESIYMYLNKDEARKLFDHLMEVLNKV